MQITVSCVLHTDAPTWTHTHTHTLSYKTTNSHKNKKNSYPSDSQAHPQFSLSLTHTHTPTHTHRHTHTQPHIGSVLSSKVTHSSTQKNTPSSVLTLTQNRGGLWQRRSEQLSKCAIAIGTHQPVRYRDAQF